jgi:hypothetical protein
METSAQSMRWTQSMSFHSILNPKSFSLKINFGFGETKAKLQTTKGQSQMMDLIMLCDVQAP